jgi:hypothetical protein
MSDAPFFGVGAVRVQAQGKLDVSLTAEDFRAALSSTAPSVSPEHLGRFAAWEKEFASS